MQTLTRNYGEQTASCTKAEKMKLAFQGADTWRKRKTGCSGKISFALAFTSILNGFTEVNYRHSLITSLVVL